MKIGTIVCATEDIHLLQTEPYTIKQHSVGVVLDICEDGVPYVRFLNYNPALDRIYLDWSSDIDSKYLKVLDEPTDWEALKVKS